MRLILCAGLALMLFGCDDKSKQRVAALTCAEHGGFKSYAPRTEHLEITCKDGTMFTVKWLP